MGKVSLIGKTLAKEGQVFTYLGPAPECEPCKLANICQGLEKGKRYKVAKVRKKEHKCPIHDLETVVAVEVEEMPIEVSVPSKKAMEAAVITLDGKSCPIMWCPNNPLCRREAFPKGTKVALVSVHEELECPKGLKLKRTVVEIK
jgi:uncharacterized protein (UPF0179 family)